MQMNCDQGVVVTPGNFTDAAGNPIPVPPGTKFAYTASDSSIALVPSADTTSVTVNGTFVAGTPTLLCTATFPDGTTDTLNPLSFTIVVPDPTAGGLIPGTPFNLPGPAAAAARKKAGLPPSKP